MKQAFRIAALFVAYSAIGFGGDYVVGLLAQGRVAPVAPEAPVAPAEVTVAREVLKLRPTVVTRVQVRHSGDCSYEADRELTISGADVAGLAIRAGSGELHVEGQADLDDVVVVGLLCASHEEYLDALDVTAEEAPDGTVTIRTHHPRQWDDSGRGNIARIDLTVLMPLGMSVDIDDSSGDMEVWGTGDLVIDDSSGSIRVTGVAGSLRIDDSSGDLEVMDVAGNVEISDGSGGLEVRDVEGTVLLRDGSGGVELSGIGMDVIVEEDGSGSIDVRTVGGDLVVDRDGSGSISHSGVEGRVEVPEKKRKRRRRPGR